MIFRKPKTMTIMITRIKIFSLPIWISLLVLTSCSLPSNLVPRKEKKDVPLNYPALVKDTVNTAQVKWDEFFNDPNLTALIDTALQNNQELNIMLQEINIAQSEVRARKGEYLP